MGDRDVRTLGALGGDYVFPKKQRGGDLRPDWGWRKAKASWRALGRIFNPSATQKKCSGTMSLKETAGFCWLFVLLFIYGSRTQMPMHALNFPTQLINLYMTVITGTF